MVGSGVSKKWSNYLITMKMQMNQGQYQNRYRAGATPPFGLPLDAGRSRPCFRLDLYKNQNKYIIGPSMVPKGNQ